MATIGLSKRLPPIDPRNFASPKLKMPPSVPHSHSPWCVGVEAPATMGLSTRESEPNFVAMPKPCTPPPGPTSQYPAWDVAGAPAGGALGGAENSDSGEYV